MFLLLPHNCQNISCKHKLNIIFLPIHELKKIFNIATLIENCLACARIPHIYATTTINHENAYRVVFNLQEKVVQSSSSHNLTQILSSNPEFHQQLPEKHTDKCVTQYTTFTPFSNLKALIL